MLSVSGQLLLKSGINNISNSDSGLILSALKSPLVIAGLVSYAVAMLLWITILSRLPLSIAYPTLSLGYIVILIFSWKFLGEELSIMKVVGIILIILGIVFLFREA